MRYLKNDLGSFGSLSEICEILVLCLWRVHYVAQYPDGTSIRTLKTNTQFLRRPFQLSVNKIFRMKAEHFGFKMKVLAS